MFELHITCSRDIEKLNINFTDGTSTVLEKPSAESEHQNIQSSDKSNDYNCSKDSNITERKKLQEYLDTDETFDKEIEVIQKPVIPFVERVAKVSDDLQNLDL